MWLLVFLVWSLVFTGGTYWYLFGTRSPFSLESVRPKEPIELDQRKRDKVLKKGFSRERIPENLDAIIIGSGLGGLSAAACLAKQGKRVLVLEQHDQAGGCCHTFTEKGFEFDVGLHYLGQLHKNSLLQVAFDQITEGQLEFVTLPQHFDTIHIGLGEERREYSLYTGKTAMEAHLKKQFPDDTEAVEKFFKLMKMCARKTHLLPCLKLIPRWLALFLLKSGIADLYCNIFRLSGTSATTWADQVTSNKDLQVIFSYLFYGKTCMTILAMVNYEWFEEWKDTTVRKRGDDYTEYKMRFANNLFNWACEHFPKLKDKLVYQEVSTPLSNAHYLGAHRGAMYSSEQNLARYDPISMAKNRCDTPIKNLYISGQDVFSCGIAGALHGGLICASIVLGHILYVDLLFIKKKLKRNSVVQALQKMFC
ncbi:hypothetical protein AALO_G00281800 [Alosa alosa]|uniref:All-trans-retinol 13,14-reductase n=1 Tax=Alosa alosa TaxID=278164 RepID=A0AAV6FMM3_9TELE|nr:hypothetical protein AALO_G00281800 [Alosa alosa]